MRGAIVHGVLLVAMLLFAYQTWTRDKSVKPTTGNVVLWNESATALTAIIHDSGDRTIKIENKGDGFWGTDTKVTKKPKPKTPPPSADGGVPAAEPPAPDETVTTVREFPVGEAITPLVTGFSSMRAIRDLGALGDEQKKEYELAEATKTVSVVFGDKTHTLVLGDKVLGGRDRYVLDVDSGRGYVIAASLLEPLEGGERSLQPKSVIPTGDDVVAIDIKAGDKQKSVARISVADDNGKQVKTWGDAQAKKADQTTANFLTKIETALKPTKYDAALDVKAMTSLVTVTYKDARGKVLGTLDLYKQEKPAPTPPAPPEGQPAPPPPAPIVEYYVVTERTRVPAQVSKASGDQVEQNIATIFQ
jgi:hypothetical protein